MSFFSNYHLITTMLEGTGCSLHGQITLQPSEKCINTRIASILSGRERNNNCTTDSNVQTVGNRVNEHADRVLAMPSEQRKQTQYIF